MFLSVFLFHKPATELDKEGETVEGDDLRSLADNLRERVTSIADIVDKLVSNGWECTMGVYDINFSHPDVDTISEAKKRLKSLEIDTEGITFDDDDLDEFGFEELPDEDYED